MRYFIDTEFVENPGTIDLISIGIVIEGSGFGYYALNKECKIAQAWENEWVRENVLKSIYNEYQPMTFGFSLITMEDIFHKHGITKKRMQHEIIQFTNLDEHPEFYGYYADYDWVVFCWIFGRMIDLPEHLPMYCRDLKQMMDEKGLTKEWKHEHCPDPEGEHNALVDAKWNLKLFNELQKIT
jgi:hypothetical protein